MSRANGRDEYLSMDRSHNLTVIIIIYRWKTIKAIFDDRFIKTVMIDRASSYDNSHLTPLKSTETLGFGGGGMLYCGERGVIGSLIIITMDVY